jgi:hypothetical protein
MAANSAVKPIHQGGRTLSKMSKKGKDGGGKKRNKRPMWWADGSGYMFGPPTSKHDRRGRIYPEGETPVKVMKVAKA